MRFSAKGSPSHETQRSRPAKRKWSAPRLTALACVDHTRGGPGAVVQEDATYTS